MQIPQKNVSDGIHTLTQEEILEKFNNFHFEKMVIHVFYVCLKVLKVYLSYK